MATIHTESQNFLYIIILPVFFYQYSSQVFCACILMTHCRSCHPATVRLQRPPEKQRLVDLARSSRRFLLDLKELDSTFFDFLPPKADVRQFSSLVETKQGLQPSWY